MPQPRNFVKELILSLVCIVACTIIALTATGSSWTRSAMNAAADVLAWAEKPAAAAKSRIDLFLRWTAERRSLLAELAELREENRTLRLMAGSRAAEDLKKYARPGSRYPVIYRDPREWWDSLRIDTGGEPAEPGMAVLDGSDLAGVVESAGSRSAWVRLITSENFYVPVVVQETREIGVVTGDSEGGVWLKYLPADGGYKAGMKIFTVLGARLPAGLPVGELTDERRSISPGIDEYRVRTGADLFRLQYVGTAGALQP